MQNGFAYVIEMIQIPTKLPGYNVLFFDKKKSVISIFFLNHRQSGYSILYIQMTFFKRLSNYWGTTNTMLRLYVNHLLSNIRLIAANKEATKSRVPIG